MEVLIAEEIRRALAALHAPRFVITSAHDGKRAGVLANSVQFCSPEPPLISVACRKGHVIGPVIRDSRRFGLFRLEDADRGLLKKFDFQNGERYEAFEGLPLSALATGSPIPRRAAWAVDCEVFRHFDLECECELYIGLIVAARVSRADAALSP
jgi:flavin reductase (DIM6/NTAB) family NADH-FMN oxidoreductase RutF